MQLVESLRRRDQKDWDEIIDNVPLFIPHSWWERTTPEGTEALTVLPGESDPDKKDGWKKLYEITERDLEEIASNTCKRFDDYGQPMKLMVGHSKIGKPQEEQPELVGFGANVHVGHYGPKKIKAVLGTTFYKKGCGEKAVEFPQRSVEFKNSTKTITGIALLKTDPRLPLGFAAYADDDVTFYASGVMAEEKKPVEPPAHKPAEPAPSKPAEPTAGKPVEGPKTPEAAIKKELEPLHDGKDGGPNEVHFANRLMKHYAECSTDHDAAMADKHMKHYVENHPMMKYLHDQHKKYMETAGSMAMPSATNGGPAKPLGAEKGTPTTRPDQPDKHEGYMDTEQVKLYEDRIAKLEHESATRYAENEYNRVVNLGIKKATLGKFKERLVAIYKGAKDDTARDALCKEFLDEVVQNYAREPRAPVSNGFITRPAAQAEGTGVKNYAEEAGLTGADQEDLVANTAAITQYAAANKIDIVNDQNGWDKAVKGYVESKKVAV